MNLMETLTLRMVIFNLLSLIVDVIRLTVEAMAKTSQKNEDSKKRLTATAFQTRAVNPFDYAGERELTLADSTFPVFIIDVPAEVVKPGCPLSLANARQLFPFWHERATSPGRGSLSQRGSHWQAGNPLSLANARQLPQRGSHWQAG